MQSIDQFERRQAAARHATVRAPPEGAVFVVLRINTVSSFVCALLPQVGSSLLALPSTHCSIHSTFEAFLSRDPAGTRNPALIPYKSAGRIYVSYRLGCGRLKRGSDEALDPFVLRLSIWAVCRPQTKSMATCSFSTLNWVYTWSASAFCCTPWASADRCGRVLFCPLLCCRLSWPTGGLATRCGPRPHRQQPAPHCSPLGRGGRGRRQQLARPTAQPAAASCVPRRSHHPPKTAAALPTPLTAPHLETSDGRSLPYHMNPTAFADQTTGGHSQVPPEQALVLPVW
jgi:hypothetical protein